MSSAVLSHLARLAVALMLVAFAGLHGTAQAASYPTMFMRCSVEYPSSEGSVWQSPVIELDIDAYDRDLYHWYKGIYSQAFRAQVAKSYPVTDRAKDFCTTYVRYTDLSYEQLKQRPSADHGFFEIEVGSHSPYGPSQFGPKDYVTVDWQPSPELIARGKAFVASQKAEVEADKPLFDGRLYCAVNGYDDRTYVSGIFVRMKWKEGGPNYDEVIKKRLLDQVLATHPESKAYSFNVFCNVKWTWAQIRTDYEEFAERRQMVPVDFRMTKADYEQIAGTTFPYYPTEGGKKAAAAPAKSEAKPALTDEAAKAKAEEKAAAAAAAEAARKEAAERAAAERAAAAEAEKKALADANRAQMDKSAADLAKWKADKEAAEAAAQAIRDDYARQQADYLEKTRIAQEAQAEWSKNFKKCMSMDRTGCDESKSLNDYYKTAGDKKAAADKPKPEDKGAEVLSWKEGVTLCQPPATPGRDATCYGPLQTTSGALGKPSGNMAIGWACGSDNWKEIGQAGGYLVYGCGYGTHPEDPKGDYPGNTDVPAKLGIGFVPGRGEFHCPRRTSAYCKTR